MRVRTGDRERGVWHYLWTGLSAGVLAVVVALGVVAVVIPVIAGATPLTVLTRSMEPTLPPGTLVVVEPTPIDTIEIGDVLTYQIESGKADVVSHRVVEVRSESTGGRTFITKGDNNDAADPEPVIEAQIKGTVWYSVPWIGYLSTNLVGSNRSWLAPAAGIGLLGYAAAMIISGLTGSKRRAKGRHRAAPAAQRAAEKLPTP